MEQQQRISVQGEAGGSGVRIWKLDPAHSTIGFSVKHMMITRVRGRFMQAEGELRIPEGSSIPKAVTVRIDVASIDTREEKRDEHLRSGDFFNAETHPRITFQSTSIEPRGDDRFTITGDLTIRDVTKRISFDARVEGRGKDPWGGERIGYSSEFSIKRSDFGITWNQALETGGMLISDEVRMELDGEAIPAT